MHRRCASWHAVPLHTFVCLTRRRRARHNVLHKTAFSDEAASFHSAMKHCSVSLHNMKHSLRSYDEKMKNESWSNPLPWRTLIRIKSPKFSAIRGHQTSAGERKSLEAHCSVISACLKSSLSALNDAIQIHCSISMWTQNIQIHNDFHFFIKIIVCFCSFICPVRIP